jgi:hypothetical protein
MVANLVSKLDPKITIFLNGFPSFLNGFPISSTAFLNALLLSATAFQFPQWLSSTPFCFLQWLSDFPQCLSAFGVVHAWVGQKRLKSNILRRFGYWDPNIAFEIQMQCQYPSSICYSYTVTPPTN